MILFSKDLLSFGCREKLVVRRGNVYSHFMWPVKWVISLMSSMSLFKPCCDGLTSFTFRRKAESYPSRSKPWTSTTASPYAIQGPYAFSDITKLPHAAPDSSIPADILIKYPCAPPQDSQCDDYENVSTPHRESGFVTNDIYETCKAQTGWVENEIYG